MTSARRFAGGAGWMAAGGWVEQAINLAVFILLARLLDAHAFGIVAMASVFVVLSEFLVRESLSDWLIAAEDPGPQDFNAVFWMLVALGLALGAVLAVLGGPLAAFYGEPGVAPVLPALAVTVPLVAATAVPVAILRRAMRFRTLALRAVAGAVCGGAAGVWLALQGWGVWALVAHRVVTVLVNVALAWAQVGWRPGIATTRGAARAALGFGGGILGLRAAELAILQAPVLIIGAVLGPVAAGIYSVALRIVEMATLLIVTPLRMAAQSSLAEAGRAGTDMGALLVQIVALATAVAYPVYGGLALVAGPLVTAVFGAGWAPSAPVLVPLALGGLAVFVERVQQSVSLATGRPGPLALIGWAGVAGVTLLALAGTRWGVAGAAWGAALGLWLPFYARLRVASRQSGASLRSLIGPHLAPLAAAAAMAPAVLLARGAASAPGSALAFAVAAGAAVYAVIAAAVMRDRIRPFLAHRSAGEGHA